MELLEMLVRIESLKVSVVEDLKIVRPFLTIEEREELTAYLHSHEDTGNIEDIYNHIVGLNERVNALGQKYSAMSDEELHEHLNNLHFKD